MMLRALFPWFKRSALGHRQFATPGLHSVEEMRRILDRERMRSDRGGVPFSLLAIRLPRTEIMEDGLPRLAAVLRGRLRLTDDAGYLPDGRIGVSLSATPVSGAWRLAEDISALMSGDEDLLVFEVYVYPSERWLTEDADHTQREREHGRQERSLEPLFMRPLPAWKRAVDVVGAVAGLIMLLPAMLVAGLAIKATSPGPVLFSQWRTGAGGRKFKLYKFRSMCVDAEQRKAALRHRSEQDGPAFKLRGDPRITPVGQFLRSSCVDELPQLWNVLKGDMSLVGPRPLPCDESRGCDAWHRRRLDVTPGLTCTWQVSPFRVAFAEWMRMDIRYSSRRHIAQDVKLLFQTLLRVVRFRASH